MRKIFLSFVALGVALMGTSLALADGESSAKPKPSAVNSISQSQPAGHKADPVKTAMGTKSAKTKNRRTSAQATPKPTTNGK